MQRRETGGARLLLISTIIASVSVSGIALASGTSHSLHHTHHATRTAAASRHRRAVHRVAWGGESCVPYARDMSGIDLPGNARDWWDNATGIYARGNVPQPGSVLAFRANLRMRLGHVAVVSRVINRREIEVDQANWGSAGGVSLDVQVVDVSEQNDWSAVRVEIGDRGDFGAIYPTYGFIYRRPDNGVLLASAKAPAPAPALNPVTVDLRTLAERDDEVAEAPPLDEPVVHHRVGKAHHYRVAHHASTHGKRPQS